MTLSSSERRDFLQHFAAVTERLGLSLLSRRQAGKELAIGYATLKRLLDGNLKQLEPNVSLAVEKPYTEVLN